MLYITTEAVVLKKTNRGESDQEIVLYTKEAGKIKVFAKGIRKINSKLKGHLLLGNLVKAEIVLKTGYRLIGASSIENFPRLRKDPIFLASLLENLGFFDKIIVLPQEDLGKWMLLLNFLKIGNLLAGKVKNRDFFFIVPTIFKLKLLSQEGYLSEGIILENSVFSKEEKEFLAWSLKKEKFSDIIRNANTKFLTKVSLQKLNLKLIDFSNQLIPY